MSYYRMCPLFENWLIISDLYYNIHSGQKYKVRVLAVATNLLVKRYVPSNQNKESSKSNHRNIRPLSLTHLVGRQISNSKLNIVVYQCTKKGY